jgi:hypothetical protein
VLAVDLFYFGESTIRLHDNLFAIAVGSVGERPLGIEASQLAAIARWVQKTQGAPPRVVAVGPRSSLIATVAAGLETSAIAGLDLRRPYNSLKDVIEQDLPFEKAPETFCFGLLERFDLPQLSALVAPRPIRQIPEPVRVSAVR